MKIPPHAKKVFQGDVLSIYQWEQEMFDGSKQVFEAMYRPPGTQIIATMNGKIVMAEEEQPGKKPFVGVLGGGIEEGEEPLEAAKRELLEESGMVSDDWELIRTYEAVGRTEFFFHLFVARDCRVVQEPHLDVGEKITLKHVDFNEFMRILASDTFRGNEIPKDFLARHYNGTLEEYKKKIFKK